MSANNWSLCPKCKLIELQRKQRIRNNAESAYGKVSSEEYRALIFKSNTVVAEKETLREDYELGITNDPEAKAEFYVSYSAHCDECGFSHHFKREEKLNFNG